MAILDQFLRVVEKVKTKVEQTARNSLAVNDEMLLFEMPSSRAISC